MSSPLEPRISNIPPSEDLPPFPSAEKALEALSSNFSNIGSFIETLSSSREEAMREVCVLREREQRLIEEIAKLRLLEERVDRHALELADAERTLNSQKESARAAEDELSAKSQALTRLKIEYLENSEKLEAAVTELDGLRLSVADFESVREQLRDSLQSLERSHGEQQHKISELTVELREKTQLSSELRAKLGDLEETVSRLQEQLRVQNQELKNTKWEFLEQREELTVLKDEMSRTEQSLKSREKDIEESRRTVRSQNERITKHEAEIRRVTLKSIEKDELLSKHAAKISVQAATVSQLEVNLKAAQNELDEKSASARVLAENLRLEKNSSASLDAELARVRESFRKKCEEFETEQRRAEESIFKIEMESLKYRDALKQRDSARADLAVAEDKIIQFQLALKDTTETNLETKERLRLAEEEFEKLAREHREVLRSEALQTTALEQTLNDLDKKTRALRKSQGEAAQLREELEIAEMKLDRQASETQSRVTKLQEELQSFKIQLQRAVRGGDDAGQAYDLRRELETKDLRISQQEQMIRMLQARLGDKRVVSINSREQNSAQLKINEENVPSSPGERILGVVNKQS